MAESSGDSGSDAAASAVADVTAVRHMYSHNRASRISEESQVSHPGSVMTSVASSQEGGFYSTCLPVAALQEFCQGSCRMLASACRQLSKRCRRCRQATSDSDTDTDSDGDSDEDEVWQPAPMRPSLTGPIVMNHWIVVALVRYWKLLRRFSFLGLNDWASDDGEDDRPSRRPSDPGIFPIIPSTLQPKLNRASTTTTMSSCESNTSLSDDNNSVSQSHRDSRLSQSHRESRRITQSRRESFDHGRGKSVADLAWMHANLDEMAMQMRDRRIKMSYYDAIDADNPPSPSGKGCCSRRCGQPLIRAFSPAAVVLAYVKLILAAWSFLVTLCIIAFWRSVRLANLPPPLGPDGASSSRSMLPQLLATDLTLDLGFLACLLLQLKTTVLHVESGSETCNGRRILWWNLTKATFWLDLVSCTPSLALWPSSPPRGRAGFVLKLFRAWRFFHTPPIYVFRPSDFFDLFRMFLCIFMGAHVFGMVWFMIIYEVEGTLDQHMEERGNLADAFVVCEADALGHFEDCVWAYVSACWHQGMYLMLGVDTGAKSALDHLFVAICTPCGLLVHAYLLGEVLMLIQRRSLLSSKRLAKNRSQEEAMSVLGLPDNLQMRIKAFTTYEHVHASGRVFEEIFTGLNPQLRFELSMHLYADFLDKSRLFRTLRPHVIRELMVLLEDVIYLPGDWVCRTGDYGNCMYFMVKGLAVMLHKDGNTELRSLRRGSYFGEVSLLMGMPWNIYVRANTFCIMARLTRDRFSPIFQRWPQDMDVLLKHHSAESAVSRREVKAAAFRNFGLRTNSVDSKSSSSRSGLPSLEVRLDGNRQPHEQRSASKPELMPSLREREGDDDDEDDGPRRVDSRSSVVSSRAASISSAPDHGPRRGDSRSSVVSNRAASISSAPERVMSRESSSMSAPERIMDGASAPDRVMCKEASSSSAPERISGGNASISSVQSRNSDLSLEDVRDRPGLPSLLEHREHRIHVSTVDAVPLKQSTQESSSRRPSVVKVSPPEGAISGRRRSAMPPTDDIQTLRERLTRATTQNSIAGNLHVAGLLNVDSLHTSTLGLPRKRSSVNLASASVGEPPSLLGVPECEEFRVGRRSSDRGPVRDVEAQYLG